MSSSKSESVILSAMQPAYFPWAGYFNLVANSTEFVFLDDVQFTKRNWDSRNQILIGGNSHWLSVPVNGSQSKKISEITLDESTNWRKKHLNTIQSAYGKHPFFIELKDVVWPIINDLNIQTLDVLDISLIKSISALLGFNPRFSRSSELGLVSKRTRKLLEICSAKKANFYYSPAGSREYMEQDGDFFDSRIEVVFQNFLYEPYHQSGNSGAFVPNLSIIDLICNLGASNARDFINRCFRPDFSNVNTPD